MDGTETEVLRREIFRMYECAFKDQHAQGFANLIDNHFNTRCFFAREHRYDHLGSMFSGAFCTTNGNTLLTISMMYCALRRLGLSRRAAWLHIGLAFGDDGAWRELLGNNGRLSEHVLWVARAFGMRIEIEECPSNGDTVFMSFLSRWYAIADGKVQSSIMDLARQLPKFQTLSRRGATIEDFVEKFSSLQLLCGHHTPVISTYIRRWLHHHRKRLLMSTENMSADNLPYCLRDLDLDLYNPRGIFPEPDAMTTELALDLAATAIGCDAVDLLVLDAQLEQASTLEEFEACFIDRCAPAVPANYLLVGDELRLAVRDALRRPAPPANQAGRQPRNGRPARAPVPAGAENEA